MILFATALRDQTCYEEYGEPKFTDHMTILLDGCVEEIRGKIYTFSIFAMRLTNEVCRYTGALVDGGEPAPWMCAAAYQVDV